MYVVVKDKLELQTVLEILSAPQVTDLGKRMKVVNSKTKTKKVIISSLLELANTKSVFTASNMSDNIKNK